jgi:hypothetical protein
MLRKIQDEAMRFKELFDQRMRKAGVTVWEISRLDSRYFIQSYHDQSDALKEYLFSDLMAEIRRATIGPEAFLFLEQFVIKGAEVGMSFSWHQDGGWWAPDCPAYVSVWLALDDMTVENGTIYVLPQSRMERRGWIAHRSGTNTTRNKRRVYLAQFSCAPILSRYYAAEDGMPGARSDEVAFFARRFLRNGKIDREDAYPVRGPKQIEPARVDHSMNRASSG